MITLDRTKPRIARVPVPVLVMLAAVTTGVGPGSAAALAQNETSRAADSTVYDDYRKLKDLLSDRYGVDVTINYSAMHMQRAGRSLSDSSHNLTGQLDLIGALRVFGGAGTFAVYYINVHQLGGITTSDFGTKNGLITPINDSDPAAYLRQLNYTHRFWDGTLELQVGKTEPAMVFAANRYAADDRARFQALPLAAPAVKDRTYASVGGFAIVRPVNWLSIGASLNDLRFSTGLPQDPLTGGDFYSFLNVTFEPTISGLGTGIYRVSWVLTDEAGDTPESGGFMVSLDQDFGDHWGAFFRYDATDIQTTFSQLNTSYATGIVYRSPFNRARDHFGLGGFRTTTETDPAATEYGGEAFYRMGFAEWLDLTFAAQIFDAGRSDETVTNLGARMFLKF